MNESYEGRPLEPMEEIPSDINQIAAESAEVIKNIAPDNDYSTQAITDLRLWLRNEIHNLDSSDENVDKIIESLERTHFFTDDESTVREKIYEVSKYLDEFITNPVRFKNEHSKLTKKLIALCEALSK